MNSQRGKASTYASRQNKSLKPRQSTKSQTNGRKRNVNRNPRRQNQRRDDNYHPFPKQLAQKSVAAAYSTGVGQSEPMITRGPNFVRIVHKELIANITGSVNYAVPFSFPLNPGMTTFLRWLPTQAVGWETYKWNKIELKAYTRTGSNVPGSIAIIPDYDASDSAPSDELSASSYKDLQEDVPWKDICCTLPHSRLHPLGKQLFIRFGAVANTDIKTYDAGNCFISTTDGTAVPWAKLWAYYDVTLFTPQLPSGGIVALSNVLHIIGVTPTTANAFAGGAASAGSNLAIATVPITGEVITFNSSGRFLVSYNVSAAVSVTVTGNPTISASGSFVTSYLATADNFDGGFNATGSGTGDVTLTLVLNAVSGTTLTFNNTIVTGSFFDLIIVGLNTITV